MTNDNKDIALNWEDNLEKLRQERAKHTQGMLKQEQPNQTIVQFEEAFEEATGEKERLLQESNPFDHNTNDDHGLLDNRSYDELLNIDIIGGEDSDFLKEINNPSEAENNVFFHSLENLGNTDKIVTGSIDSFMPFDIIEDNQNPDQELTPQNQINQAKTKPHITLPITGSIASPSPKITVSESSSKSAIQVDNNGPVVKANSTLNLNLPEKTAEQQLIVNNQAIIPPTASQQSPSISATTNSAYSIASDEPEDKVEDLTPTQSLPTELEIVDEINIFPLNTPTALVEQNIIKTATIAPKIEPRQVSLSTEFNQKEQTISDAPISNKPEQTTTTDFVIQVQQKQPEPIVQTTEAIKEPLAIQKPIGPLEEISIEDIKPINIIKPRQEEEAQPKQTDSLSHDIYVDVPLASKLEIKASNVENTQPISEMKYAVEKIPELNLAVPQNKTAHADITAEIVTQKPISLVGEHQLIESVVQQLSVSIHETVMNFVKEELDKQTEQITQTISQQLPSILTDMLQNEVKTAIEKTKQQLK